MMKMIEQYPQFTKLHLGLKDELRAITAQFDPYSDFDFTSLFCWDTNNTTSVSRLNGNLVIKLPDYITGEPVYSLIGNSSIDQSLTTLLSQTKSLGLVPEIVINSLVQPENFTINEDMDNYDYIYNASDIAYLPGAIFKKKRNKIRGAEKELSKNLIVTNTNQIDLSEQTKLYAVCEKWTLSSKQSLEELSMESIAIHKILENSSKINLSLTTISLGSETVAFSINEVLSSRFAICHFEKALPVHEQIYSLIANQAAKYLVGEGCLYLNWEQDLGLPGLRKSKLSFQPARFLKKYTVSLTN